MNINIRKYLYFNILVKVAKKYIFLSFWVKHDTCDVYLKYGFVQNRLCERYF